MEFYTKQSKMNKLDIYYFASKGKSIVKVLNKKNESIIFKFIATNEPAAVAMVEALKLNYGILH